MLLFFNQALSSFAACNILSANASGPSSIQVKWQAYPAATMYILDFRVLNDPNSIPVVVVIPTVSLLLKDVQGLKSGTNYVVTLKVFQFYTSACVNTTTAWTGK